MSGVEAAVSRMQFPQALRLLGSAVAMVAESKVHEESFRREQGMRCIAAPENGTSMALALRTAVLSNLEAEIFAAICKHFAPVSHN